MSYCPKYDREFDAATGEWTEPACRCDECPFPEAAARHPVDCDAEEHVLRRGEEPQA